MKYIQGMPDWSDLEIRQIVMDYINEVLAMVGENAEVVDLAIYGSRSYGGALESSDLDVVVEYRGDIREDDFFNLLHDEDEPFEIDGIEVDINPITEDKTGTLDEFLNRTKNFRKRPCSLDCVIEGCKTAGENINLCSQARIADKEKSR